MRISVLVYLLQIPGAFLSIVRSHVSMWLSKDLFVYFQYYTIFIHLVILPRVFRNHKTFYSIQGRVLSYNSLCVSPSRLPNKKSQGQVFFSLYHHWVDNGLWEVDCRGCHWKLSIWIYFIFFNNRTHTDRLGNHFQMLLLLWTPPPFAQWMSGARKSGGTRGGCGPEANISLTSQTFDREHCRTNSYLVDSFGLSDWTCPESLWQCMRP